MFGLSIALLVFVLDTSLKAALVALAAAALMKLLRLGDSNLRHRIWTGVLAGMLLLPLLTPVVPALQLPVPVAIDRLMLIEGEQVTPNPSLAGDSPNSVPSTDYSVRLAAPPSLHGDEYAADNVEPSALLDAAGPELDSWPIASAPPSPAPPLASDGPPARSIPTAGRRYSLAATLVVALVAAWIIGT